jgi:hypothetical protein
MSYTYEEHIKYKIERELEHLAWLKRNMPKNKKALERSLALLERHKSKLTYIK